MAWKWVWLYTNPGGVFPSPRPIPVIQPRDACRNLLAANHLMVRGLDRILAEGLPAPACPFFAALAAPFAVIVGLLLSSTCRATDYVAVEFPGNVILDSQDQPVGTNRTVWVGTFTNADPEVTNATFVMNLARTNTNGLDVVTSWSNRFARLVQTNFLGRDLILTNRPTSAMTNRPVYVWMFNHTNPAQATEMILWRSQAPEFFDRSLSLDSPVPVVLEPANPSGSGAALYGSAPLFGQYLPAVGSWRMSPIATHLDRRTTVEQISLSGVDWFIGDTNAALDLPANNGPTGFTVVVTNNGSTSPLSTLGLSYSNGRISGLLTATNTNQHVLWVTATNSHGLTAAASNTLTLRVRSQTGPLFTNPGVMSLTAGSDFAGFQLLTESSTNLPLSFTCLNGSELAGLSLSSAGLFSGTSFNTNTRLLRLQVQDSAGNVRRGSLTYVGTAPSLTIAATNAEGALEIPFGTQTNLPVTFTSGFDDGTLEAELTGSEINGFASATFDGATLTILTNRPPTPRGSNPVVQVLANRTIPTVPPKVVTASKQIPVRILAPPPVLSITPSVQLFVGDFTNISISAGSLYTDSATTYTVENLPTGMSFNQATKSLEGENRSTNQAEWRTLVSADNRLSFYGGGISAPTEILFQIRNRQPDFTVSDTNSPDLVSLGGVGKPFRMVLTATNYPSTSQVTGLSGGSLPTGLVSEGLSFDGAEASLTISGVPSVAGSFPIHLSVFNYEEPGNPDSAVLSADTRATIHISGERPLLSSAGLTSPDNLVRGTLASFYLSPNADKSNTGRPDLYFTAYGLPSGLAVIDARLGKVEGTPQVSGSFQATVFVVNGKSWIKQSLNIIVREEP